MVRQLPHWWCQGQQEAWNRFQSLPYPHSKNEAWRFASTSKLRLEGFLAGVGVSSAAQTQIREAVGATPSPWTMAFGNDVWQFGGLGPQASDQGVIFCTLDQALHRHSELVQRHFLAETVALGGEKYAALHRAHCRNGMFLHIPRGVELTQPIEVFYWLTDSTAASFPHNLIVAGPNSKADVRFHYRCTDAARGGLVAGINQWQVGDGAQLRTVHLQRLSEASLSWHQSATVVERDARSTSLNLNLGCSYARLENTSRLIGPGAHSEMLSLTASHGHQEFDQRTFQEHAAPHTVSDLLYKNALSDQSRTIFAGMIDVDPSAQQTNAYQSNRNLLLSGQAEADSLPGLEILANDVRCTHGSTTGQINAEELFYLQQRGIPLSVARRLFVVGFFAEVIERLKDEKLGQELHALVEAKFDQAPSV